MALSGLMSKVNFANKVPMLMRATSSDRTLPAGHVYEEISRITYDSLDQCDVLVEFLTDRLKKNSPNIKLKVLLIMKAVLQKGHKEFQHSLSRQAQGIREARSFNGPADPLHGDAPYVKVREAAAELLEMLFDTDRDKDKGSTPNAYGHNTAAVMEGFGNSRQISSGSTTLNSRSMEGFGSTTSSNSQETTVISDVFQRVKDNVSYVLNQNTSTIAKYQQNEPEFTRNSYRQYRDDKIVRTPSKTFNLSGSRTNDQIEDSNLSYEPENSNACNWKKSSDAEEESFTIDDSYRNVTNETVEKAPDWSQEVRLVNDITIPAGIRLNPARSELEYFLKRCSSLDFVKIVELISEKLQCPDYKVQMKALFVVEGILSSSISNANEIVSTKLQDDMERLSSSYQTAVKNKATKLLHLVRPRQAKSNTNQPYCGEDQTGELFSIGQDPVSRNSNLDNLHVKEDHSTSGADQLASIFGVINLKDDVNDQNLMIDRPLLGEPSNLSSNTSVSISEVPLEQSYSLFGHSSLEPQCNTGTFNPKVLSNAVQPETSSATLLDLDPFTVGETNSVAGTTAKSNFKSITASSNSLVPNADNNLNFSTQSDSNFDILDPFSSNHGSSTKQQPSPAAISSNQMALQSNGSVVSRSAATNAFQATVSMSNHNVFPNIQEQGTLRFQNSNMHLTHNSPLPGQPSITSQPILTQARPEESSDMPSRDTIANANQGRRILANKPNNAKPQSSNGFQFLSSKKPGAFDFVKEAMEASKRK